MCSNLQHTDETIEPLLLMFHFFMSRAVCLHQHLRKMDRPKEVIDSECWTVTCDFFPPNIFNNQL